MNLAPHLTGGRDAENRALDMLTAVDLQLLVRDYHSPQGEWGRVTAQAGLRRERGCGDAADSVHMRKQPKLLQAAQHFQLQDAVSAADRCDSMLSPSVWPATGNPGPTGSKTPSVPIHY